MAWHLWHGTLSYLLNTTRSLSLHFSTNGIVEYIEIVTFVDEHQLVTFTFILI